MPDVFTKAKRSEAKEMRSAEFGTGSDSNSKPEPVLAKGALVC
jgi:hypothetical protein